MENSRFEPPKQAIIRLLRSQGCCQSDPIPNSHLAQMQSYRQQLQMQVTRERNKLAEIPCAVTLAEQIAELKEVVEGLSQENRKRVEQLGRMRQKVTVNYEAGGIEDQYEHQRLQNQYSSLLKALENTNETNRRLVERLTRL